MSILTNDIRYPIGKFEWPREVTAAERKVYIDTIRTLPQKLRAAVAGVRSGQLDIPYRDGGWTIRQMVHHIPDSHMNSYMRFKLALTEDNPTVKPYDEARWAESEDARTAALDSSLGLLDGLHERWVILLGSMTEAEYERGFLHPEIGPVKLKSNLALYDWHSRHHLAQIMETARRLSSAV